MLMTSEPFFVMVLKEAYGIKINLFFFLQLSLAMAFEQRSDAVKSKTSLYYLQWQKKILLVLFNVQLH